LRVQVLSRGRDLHALRLRGVDRRVHEQLELADDAAWALECGEQAIRIANRLDREGATDLDPVDLERARAQDAHRASRDPNLVDSDRLRSSVAQLIQQVVHGDGVELTVDAKAETLPDHSCLPAERGDPSQVLAAHPERALALGLCQLVLPKLSADVAQSRPQLAVPVGERLDQRRQILCGEAADLGWAGL